MILILSGSEDPHVNEVLVHLDELGGSYLRWDPASFPLRSKLVLRHGAAGRSAELEIEGRWIDLRAVRVVWLRRPGRPACGLEHPDERVRRYADDECAELLEDLWASLDAVWFPAPRWHVLRLQRKHWPLAVAAELGFTVPETLIGNDPDAFFDFYRDHGHGPGKAIIGKLHGTAMVRHLGQDLRRYTEIVGHRDIAALRSVTTGPLVFQAYVPKHREVRVTVVGDTAFAVEIDSQATRRTRRDWRRYDERRTPHRAHALPPDVATRCVGLCRRLELRFGAIDLILRPDGEYVFVEINPSGQYLWLESLSGVPLSRAVAEELVRLAGPERAPERGAPAEIGATS